VPTLNGWLAVAFAVALLFAGIAAPVGSADAAAEAAAGPTEAPTLTVQVDRTDSTIRYRTIVRAPADADRVRLDGAFGILNVTRADGFVTAGNGYRLADGREQATLTAIIDLDDARDTPLGKVGPDGSFQAGENWAFAPSPRYHVRSWTSGNTTPRSTRLGSPDADTETAVHADAPVAVGERFVFLGPHDVRTRTVEGQRVELIVPEAASFALGADRSFRLAGRTYQEAGATPERPVTAFVLPETVRAGGGASGTDLWLRADASEQTLTHEFAHTALTLPTTAETQWLSEAAAEYLAYQVTHEERVTDTLRRRAGDDDAVLADRTTWESDYVAYRKGAALLALLDERVRTATDGEHSLTDVLTRLSAMDGPIDPAELRKVVTATADESTAAWLDEQATGTAPAVAPATQSAGFVTFDVVDQWTLGDSGAVPSGSPRDPLTVLTSLGALSVLFWVPVRLGYGLYRRRFPRGSAT
jgi:hypothetical protein